MASKEYQDRVNEMLVRQLGNNICRLLDEADVTEIILNSDGRLWVERHGRPMQEIGTMEATQAESLIRTIASSIKETITPQNPILECELPLDGSRFEGLLPPVVSGPCFTIRKRALMVFALQNYVEQGIMTGSHRAAIEDAVRNKKNILIVGGTGTGKTTLTNAVIRSIVDLAPHDRLVILEDTRELQCSAANFELLRAVEQADMTRLLKATMRMRPDRILVGEVRDGAALDLLKAWNTGHPGGVATIHANSAYSGLIRMEQLVAEATHAAMHTLIAEAVDLIVSIEKHAGSRRIGEVLKILGHDGQKYLTTVID